MATKIPLNTIGACITDNPYTLQTSPRPYTVSPKCHNFALLDATPAYN